MIYNGRKVDVLSVLQSLGIDTNNRTSEDEIVTQCPWSLAHSNNDRNFSFSINAESGAWICFTGCGSGSLFTLVSEVRKCTKSESGTWILTAASDVIAYDTLLSSMPLFSNPCNL